MKKELIVALTRIERMEAGQIIPKPKKLLKRREKILKVLKLKEKMSKLQFLKKISQNIVLC